MGKTLNKQVRLLIALLLVSLAGYIYTGVVPSPTQARDVQTATIDPQAWYPVVRVSDGDTLVINNNGTDMTVRLIGINSPELNSSYTKEECYGKEASEEAKKVISVGPVRLEIDPSQDLYDQYDRLLAYVYVPANIRPEGIMVNDYMVQGGFAREYTFRKPYAHQKEFKADQMTAREAGRGLWAACASSS